MRKKIAICFFGITRSLSFTIESIKRNVIVPTKELGDVKVICHFFNQKEINNPRSGEQLKLDPEEYKLLAPDFIKLEKPNSFLADSDFNNVIGFGDAFGDNNFSTKNLFHQLWSISQVTDSARVWGADIVVFVRPDILYHDSFQDALEQAIAIDEPRVYAPNWQHWDGVNDRFAIAVGSKAIESYGKRYNKILEYCTKTNSPLHSEKLLDYSLKKIDRYFIKHRASRVRASGERKQELFLHYRIFDMQTSIARRLNIKYDNAILKKFANGIQNIIFGNPYKDL